MFNLLGILYILLSGLFFSKSKFLLLTSVFIFFIISSFNYNNADYENYLLTYNSIRQGGEYFKFFENYEFSYKAIARFGSFLNLDYHTFRITVFAIGSCLLYYIFKFYQHKNLIFTFYILFNGLLDIVQVRNFLSFLFIILAYNIYFSNVGNNNFNKKNYLRIYVSLIIAVSFQFSAIIFFISFMVTDIMKNFGKLKTLILIGTVIIFAYYNFIEQLAFLIQYLSYFETLTSFNLFIISILIISCYLLFIVKYSKNKISRIDTLLFVFPILVVLPGIFFNIEFLRIYRNILPAALGLFILHKYNIKSFLQSSLLVLPFSYLFLILAGKDTVLIPVLNLNQEF
jgi:hypothetical protein